MPQHKRSGPSSPDVAAAGRSRKKYAGLRAVVGAVAITLLGVGPLFAATFTVNSTEDSDDGACGRAVGECTLREALPAADATPGRATIRFDKAVFVAGSESVRIELVKPLPLVADPAGTVVDGAGASVRIYGSDTITNGLVLTSAPDVALGKVTVANVAVQGFAGHGIHICGGEPPECGADVTGALLRNVVAVNCGGTGIRVEGRVNKKPRVLDSVTFGTGNDGIRLSGSRSMIGARVEGSTATRCGGSGIALRAEQQTGSAIVDSFGLKCVEDGVLVSDDGATIKPTIANVVALGNRNGIALTNDQLIAPTITSSVATDNEVGVKVLVNGSAAPTITKVVADANIVHGINVEGGSGVTISRSRVVANGYSGIAAETSVDLDVVDVVAMGNLTGVTLGSSNGIVTGVNAANNRGHGIGVELPGGNTVIGNLTLANGVYSAGVGIVQGSGGNVVRENVALGHIFDLYDDNANCGTNLWTANVFTEGTQPCIR
jgi:CSLREA domain-containing protein